MRGGKPVLLPKWWSPPGPESESAPGPESESEAGSGLQCVYLSLRKFLGFRCRRVAGLTPPRCSRLSWARRWALARCLEHHPKSDQPGHVEQAASMQDTLSERTARAAQLAPSAVTASAVGGSATRSVVAESLRRRRRLVEEHARSRGVELNMMASSTETCSVGCILHGGSAATTSSSQPRAIR